MTAGEARGYLARFLFRGDDVFKEVRTLSGGERSRLELALLGIMPANLLLLDEPTNHLDIPAREAIEAFLRETPATVLVVSHDRRLLETICDRLWVVADGLAVPFDGGYRAWRAAVAEGWTRRRRLRRRSEARRLPRRRPGARPAPRRAVRAAVASAGAGDGRAATAARRRRRRPRSRRRAGPRRRSSRRTPTGARRRSIEAELTRLGLRKNHLEMAIGDPLDRRQLRRAAADHERARRRGRRRWRRPRRRGSELEERAP